VLSLAVGKDTRAYPVRVMIWHEIVNDTVGGVPVAVTYCPLCNTAITFDRRVGERTLSFGTSGLLYQSDLVMYDRQTSSLWPQLEGTAVAGFLTGTELDTLPVQTVAWSDFAAANPDAWVLSEQTGFDRNYGANPYRGYDDEATDPFLFDGDTPGPLPAKARIVGIGDGAGAVAVTFERLQRELVVPLTVAGRDIVTWLQPGLRSALDAGELADGRQVGASGAFVPTWQGQDLTFTATDNGFVDAETGSTWDVTGRAVSGSSVGAQLEPVTHVDTFWFAWIAFQPQTELQQ
jgi:hypothetical protein